MIFKSLIIREGIFKKEITFSPKVNLIYSDKNSVGKTTLLRFLLYSMGYPIPSTKGIKFENCEVESVIENNNNIFNILRNNDYLEIYYNGKKKYFSLPLESNEFHKLLYNTSNTNILNNILASYYFDQEKGWTLLNRGHVIGINRFNIEQLVRGLSDIDCSNQLRDLSRIERQISKYRKMFNVANYQNEINELKENIVYENHSEIVNKEIILLEFEKKSIMNDVKKIDTILDENKSFAQYIEKMKINVQSNSGELIPVNQNTISGFIDNLEILLTKKKMKLSQISSIQNKINLLENQRKDENQLLNVETVIQHFDKKISEININPLEVDMIIKKLDSKRNRIRENISSVTKTNNIIITELYDLILRYVDELKLGKYIKKNRDFIFTSDLKSLSGTILHKMVFIFKLAYIKAIERKLNFHLPIILDSPSGREIKKDNVSSMINILKRDFRENQIIIASIHKYDFDDYKVIELKDYLFDSVKDNRVEE